MHSPLPPENISLLAEKWMKGTLSAAELQVFNNWYNQFNDEELVLATEQDAHHSEDIQQRMLQQIERRMQLAEAVPVKPLRPARWLVAAALAGMVLLAGYLSNRGKWMDLPTIAKTGASEREKLVLPDSTIVWLKPNSSIDYKNFYKDGERHIELQGEALFEVAKNPGKPFVIRSGDYITRVLGTSFSIKHNTRLPFELTVFTGKVMVEKLLPNGTKLQHIITPHQKLTTAGAKEPRLLTVLPEEKLQATEGTEYMMDFNNTPFLTIAERLEKKFNVKCIIRSQSLLNCRLTADLTDQSLFRSLQLIAASIDMDYQFNNGEVLLSGAGCE